MHALDVTKDNDVAHYNLANHFAEQGKMAQAIEHFEKVLQITPDSAPAHHKLGNALLIQGKFRDACGHIKRSLEIQADNPDAKNNLAWALATCPDPDVRNPSEAVLLAEDACKGTNYSNPGLLDTLAGAVRVSGEIHRGY